MAIPNNYNTTMKTKNKGGAAVPQNKSVEYARGGGCCNIAQGMHSFIGSGGGAGTPTALNNQALANYSFIGTGQQHLVDTGAHYGTITGGQQNTINSGFQHSFIAGGLGNTINAHCAAILGGSNNTVNHDHAAVFGNGLTTAASNTLHVECINAVNTPIGFFAGLPVGTIFADTTPPPPALALPLYIRI